MTGLVDLPAEISPYQQSDRTGEWKRYHFETFRLALEPQQEPLEGTVTQWLTLEDFLDENRRPISPTARHVLEALGETAHFD